MHTPEELDEIEARLNAVCEASKYAHVAQALLQDVRQCRKDCDSELAGEVELLRERVESYQQTFRDIENICVESGVRGQLLLVEAVKDLAQQKERADKLQYEVEQLRAARESLEPVAWMYHPDENGRMVPRDAWFGRDFATLGHRRRVHLSPPQPIDSEAANA